MVRSDAEPAALLAAAKVVLEDWGLTTATEDAENGLMITEWVELEAEDKLFKYRWRITLDAGAVHVRSECNHRSSSSGAWTDCGDLQKPGQTEEAKNLAQTIVDGAQG